MKSHLRIATVAFAIGLPLLTAAAPARADEPTYRARDYFMPLTQGQTLTFQTTTATKIQTFTSLSLFTGPKTETSTETATFSREVVTVQPGEVTVVIRDGGKPVTETRKLLPSGAVRVDQVLLTDALFTPKGQPIATYGLREWLDGAEDLTLAGRTFHAVKLAELRDDPSATVKGFEWVAPGIGQIREETRTVEQKQGFGTTTLKITDTTVELVEIAP